ncbi:2,6-dioxo-6-phenylhexa-3-enoate hydrolase [Steroidobacter agaridevorans]|uniref:2,6-dioxo-6-phenylhexa-3-enoate hydrolase n=1 Tax=Steroidobacter agaridevorans TaxID=2695856 RepID=A0A829YP91_9GAMM|nr:alpha/beta hydrolase [Steroidobacter agaridevorans]GFE84652.1 2,6-dioxo-6-phenylhexa-3-enoate hydrolase [Steroidobacter agaridevorans]
MSSLGTEVAVKQERISAAGIDTSYLVCGDGPDVILLHGSGPGVSAAANWQNVLPLLGREYRVYAPDIVGFGDTERPADASYDIKLWSRHLIGFMDALGLQQAALVGNSFGGGLSLAVALRHPQRVSHLVLMGTPAGEFEQTAGLRSAYDYEPSMANMAAMLRMFPYDSRWVTAEMIETRHEASLRHGGQAAFRKLIPPPNPSGPTIVRGVPEASLRTIQQPTLVLHGREDRVVPLQCAQLLLQALPNCELHAFGQCGHWVQIEKQSRFVALLRQFLRTTEDRPCP